MQKLKILFVEDLTADVEIAAREIRKEKISFDFIVVETADLFRKALTEFQPDLIISDYSMPGFDGMSALKIVRAEGGRIPFIVLTGSMNEETAVACLRAGADDYVLKERIKRLPFAVKEVVEKRRIESEREEALCKVRQNEETLKEIIDNSRDIHYKQNLDTGEILFISPASLPILGYTPEEMKSMTLGDQADLFHPDDFPALRQFRNELIQSFLEGIPKLERDFRARTKNREYKWIHGSYTIKTDDEKTPKWVLGVLQDVTHQKEIDIKLAESNRQKELILNSTTEMFAYYDLNLKVIWANQASARSVGKSLEEIQGLPCYQLWQHSNEPCEDCVVLRALETGEPKSGEQVTPDGRHWQLRGYPVFNDKGEVEALVELGMDITAQKKAEEALAESEETYRNLFQNAQVGLFRTRITDGKILEGNDQIARMFGYGNREEFIAEYTTTGNYVDPGTRERMLEQIKKQGFIESFKARFYRKDRSVFHASYSARIYPERGWIEGVVEDITEKESTQKALKEASENWKTTFRSMKDGIALLDADQHILQSNAAFQEFVGKTEDELKQGKCFQYIHGTDCPIDGCPFVRMKASKGRETIEMKIGNRVCDIIVDPILDEIGEITGAVHVLTDITQRKQMIRELVDAKEKAEESDRLKSAFLANMSHEIRTPMNGIMGFTELLKEPDLSEEEQQRFVEIIRKSGDRLLNTVNDLIDISRIETGQMPVNYDSVSIMQQLEGLVSFFIPQAEQKGLQLVLDIPADFPHPIIYTDQAKLESILTNLIKNAIKYTETGEIRVKCQVENEELKFRISDTGIGVPDNRKEAIFNRFEQADISDTRAFQGSGLGLSIAKAYVEMLGGEIGVESTEGLGSTFWFTLPLEPRSVVQPEIIPDSEQVSEPGADRPEKRPIILVAEDDEDSYLYLSEALSGLTQKLIRTTTGTETVELCRNHPGIDLILMDIKMPLMDGYEATRQIRKFNKEVVIIAQTAYALTGDKEKALEAGCNDYMTKPVNKNRLTTVLSKHLVGKIP